MTTTTSTSTTFDWSSVAPAWDRHRDHVEDMKRPATEALLDDLAVRPGDVVVELGAGTGELSRRLASAVGPEGRVVSSDVAEGMVALLSATCAGLDNVEVRRLDATAIDLPDGMADVVVFRMGLMLLPDPATAVAEIVRILRPGGHFGAVVWAGPEHNPWMVALGMAAMASGVVSGLPTQPGMPFSLGDPARVEQLLAGAGLVDVSVREVDTPPTFADEEAHFDTVASLAGPLGAAIARASAEQKAAIRATAAQIVAPFRTATGELVVPGRSLVAVGHVAP